MLGGSGSGPAMPRIEEVSEDGGAGLPGDHRQTTPARPGGSRAPIRPGTPLAAPAPLFTKLDPTVADEELARLEQG